VGSKKQTKVPPGVKGADRVGADIMRQSPRKKARPERTASTNCIFIWLIN